MERKEFSIARFLSSKSRFDNIVLLEGFIVGILAGVVAVIYRLMLSYGEKIAYFVVDYIKNNTLHLCLWIICVLLIGFIISRLLKYESYISGSGIPQVEAEMIDQIDEKWYRVILAKLVAGTLAIVGGLSLGREGPSIQLGAMIGKGLATVFKRMKLEEKYLLTCGAAAGLSAAFNAPLAGVLFALEEIHKNFSPLALVTVMVASLTGDFISKNIFGMTPSLYFPLVESLPLGQYGFLIILGIIVGLLGVFYNKTTMFTLKLYDKIINKNLLIRQIYLTVGNLLKEDEIKKQEDKFEQIDLFTNYKELEKKQKEEKIQLEKEKNIQNAIINIKNKYGKNAIIKAMDLEKDATTIERNGQIGGHKG